LSLDLPLTSVQDPSSLSVNDDQDGPAGTIRTPSPPLSPDAFGTFEVGEADSQIDPWEPSGAFQGQAVDPDGWSSPWAGGEASAETEPTSKEETDEWDLAKRRKEEMDRRLVSLLVKELSEHCLRYNRSV